MQDGGFNMRYALIENGQVTKTRLPKTGVLSDGSTVSNYNLLPHDVLIAEGWLPLIDDPPDTDEKHRAVRTGYEIYGDRVEAIYSIEEIIPPPIQTEELVEQAQIKAQKLAVKSLIQNDSLSTEEIIELAPLFPAYEVGKVYKIGDIFTYKRSLYEVIQAHTSQADWLPDSTPSLYKNHTPKGEIEDWRQPLGAHDAYRAGDVVTYNGNTYTSLIDNNVWIPDQYGWELYVENPPEYPEWVQPTGAHDDYDIGAIVTHNEQTWISIVANNVWEPGVYGWEVYTG
jgi:hypothetical protein